MGAKGMEVLLPKLLRASPRLRSNQRFSPANPAIRHCSSAPLPSNGDESEGKHKGSSDVPPVADVVSYAPKPKPREAEVEPASSTSEGGGDSTGRPLTREEIRYLKDVPSIPTVSYNVRVAPLPQDRVFNQKEQEEKKEEPVREQPMRRQKPQEDIGLVQGLKQEVEKFNAKMLFQQEEINLPFPRLVPPPKKAPKIEYDLLAGIDCVKVNAKHQTDETVEVHVRLGVEPKRSDQMVRGGCPLPHGIGKTVKVAVFAGGAAVNEARAAGADIAGGEELVNQIKEGSVKVAFEKCIATPEFMPHLGKIGRILGPCGLMPNPKSGTVTNDVAKAVKEAKRGRVDFKMDKDGIIFVGLGKVSFADEQLYDNIVAFLNALLVAKPIGLKTTSKFAGYIKTFALKSSMGHWHRISIQSLNQAIDEYLKLNSES